MSLQRPDLSLFHPLGVQKHEGLGKNTLETTPHISLNKHVTGLSLQVLSFSEGTPALSLTPGTGMAAFLTEVPGFNQSLLEKGRATYHELFSVTSFLRVLECK